MAPNPLSSDAGSPPRPLIEVHNARNPSMLFTGLGLLAVTVLVSVALYLKNPQSPPSFPWFLGGAGPGVIGGISGGLLGVGLLSFIRRRVLTYDPQTRSVEARDRMWGLWQDFPSEGFDRLEYEAGTGRLYEVRTDGRRRRVPVNRGEAIGTEWRAFVEQFERDHAPGEPGSS